MTVLGTWYISFREHRKKQIGTKSDLLYNIFEIKLYFCNTVNVDIFGSFLYKGFAAGFHAGIQPGSVNRACLGASN